MQRLSFKKSIRAVRHDFGRMELMSTLAGAPRYRACGHEPVEHVTEDLGGTAVPLVRMQKTL